MANESLLTRIRDKHFADYQDLGPRERILLASLKLFVEQGYFNTNIPDLSRESKCSVGSIYHHYRNKEEVATALYETGLAAFRHALSDKVLSSTGPEQLFKEIVHFFLSFSEEYEYLARYMWLSRHSEFMSGQFLHGKISHPTMIGFDPLGRRLTIAIKAAIRDGQIRSLKANIIWSVLFGIPLSYVRDWLDGYNLEPPSQVADTLAETCWLALQA